MKKEHKFTDDIIEKLEWWINKYPKDQRNSAIIPGLHVIQEANNGYLTKELMKDLAQYLRVEQSSVYEVATFYGMYNHSPVGRHIVNVCDNISCMLKGANEIVRHIEKRLEIKRGQTTTDGRITLKTVECQGACCGAPMLEVDKVFYENLTIEKVDQLIDGLE